jgi:hypothetical protein
VKGKLAALVGGELFSQAHHNSGSRVVAGDCYIATSTNDNALFHRRLLRRYAVGMRNKLEEQVELDVNPG